MRESAWFKEGYAAWEYDTKCPYGERSAKWYLWQEGWKASNADNSVPNTGQPQ